MRVVPMSPRSTTGISAPGQVALHGSGGFSQSLARARPQGALLATPLDPKQLARRAREQQVREAAEEKAQLDRRVVEAGDYTLMGVVVERLTRSGESFDCASLASQLNSEPDAVRRALDLAVKAGTVTESNGRYRAAQR